MVLIGYWPLNETSGSTAYDRSGQDNHGTLNGGVTQGTTGILGQTAYQFDGTDDYINVGPALDPGSSDFTISMWVKPSSFSSNNDLYATNENNSPRYLCRIETDGTLRFYCGDGSTKADANGSTSLSTGTWYLLTFRRKGDKYDILLNASIDGSTSVSNGDISGGETEWIGANASDSKHTAGTITEVRIYNHALTKQEIQYLYQVSQKGRITTSKR